MSSSQIVTDEESVVIDDGVFPEHMPWNIDWSKGVYLNNTSIKVLSVALLIVYMFVLSSTMLSLYPVFSNAQQQMPAIVIASAAANVGGLSFILYIGGFICAHHVSRIKSQVITAVPLNKL